MMSGDAGWRIKVGDTVRVQSPPFVGYLAEVVGDPRDGTLCVVVFGGTAPNYVHRSRLELVDTGK